MVDGMLRVTGRAQGTMHQCHCSADTRHRVPTRLHCSHSQLGGVMFCLSVQLAECAVLSLMNYQIHVNNKYQDYIRLIPAQFVIC